MGLRYDCANATGMSDDMTMIDLTEKRKPPQLMSGNRCDDCLTPASRASLDLIRQENPDIGWFDNTGICASCGVTNDVHDIAHLLIMRFHGLIRGVPSAPGHPSGLLNGLRNPNPDWHESLDFAKHRDMVANLDRPAAEGIA
jgi:hypothetical protein